MNQKSKLISTYHIGKVNQEIPVKSNPIHTGILKLFTGKIYKLADDEAVNDVIMALIESDNKRISINYLSGENNIIRKLNIYSFDISSLTTPLDGDVYI
jgi:hypothetical protein